MFWAQSTSRDFTRADLKGEKRGTTLLILKTIYEDADSSTTRQPPNRSYYRLSADDHLLCCLAVMTAICDENRGLTAIRTRIKDTVMRPSTKRSPGYLLWIICLLFWVTRSCVDAFSNPVRVLVQKYTLILARVRAHPPPPYTLPHTSMRTRSRTHAHTHTHAHTQTHTHTHAHTHTCAANALRLPC